MAVEEINNISIMEKYDDWKSEFEKQKNVRKEAKT